ncbi:hypothetical protein F5X99DRAFT_380237 [Biscogniauxia marginata]|nr:hypothetical protein F5X99DRAFT_380237 [Biscogniauxia marginata]
MYETRENWHGPGVRTAQLVVNHLMAGFVFFDEFHNYRGQRSSRTAAFVALEKITSNSPDPVIAVGLSGSLRSSPSNWRPFVYHLFYSAQKHNWVTGIAGMNQASDLDQHETDWDYLINHLHNPPDEGKRLEDFNARRANLKTFLQDFIPSMMLCRQKGSEFRGRQIFQPAAFQETAYDMREGHTRAAFRELAQRVKAWCNQTFEVQHNRWRADGSPTDDEPLAVAVERGLLDEAAQNPRKNTAFETTCHASTYPTVARLVFNQLVPYDEMLVTNITPVANRVSSLLRANSSSAEVIDALKESPWWNYRVQLREESRKFEGVIGQIDRLLALRGLPPTHNSITSLGPLPADGTSIRHALVLSDSPLSAFLSFMLLYQNYVNDPVELIYLHGGLSAAQRADLCQNIQKDCVPGDPVKVLIGSFQMAAEGYNLQRANYCILTEVPRRPDTQNQAFGRVDRKGQQMKPVLIQMFDHHNLAEMVRVIRNRNRATLAQIGHEGVQIDLNDFV